ncbi:MAG: pantoate--beta-alanine ligase [Actinomyces sp.]|nr:pantoate--beta-alanine ligase [Actinomyces sp.]
MTHRPVLTHTRAELADALSRLPGTKALVMTMGALHSGHLQLVREARELADHVIVTIFVNPTQFAPGEDFDAYPRTLDADMDALETVGADLVWAPAPQDVYPTPATVTIDPGPIARVLEGKTRPTHFAGVALVCTKVVNLVRPDVALYGQKDAQQLAVLRTVFAQLDIPVRVHPVPIVRAEDGVALSSRNQYLSDDERIRARALSRALRRGAEAAEAGAEPAQIVAQCRSVIEAEGGIDLDYIALVDAGTFEILAGTESVPVGEGTAAPTILSDGSREGRILIAAKVGTTRLIDNMEVPLRGASTPVGLAERAGDLA